MFGESFLGGLTMFSSCGEGLFWRLVVLGTRLLPTSKELSKEVTPNFLGLRISAVEVKLSLLRSFPL